MTYQRHAFANAEETERLLHHMPAVASNAENEWAVNFARSIIRQARRRRWRPSEKQLNIMRSLVSDLFAGVQPGEDLQVIED